MTFQFATAHQIIFGCGTLAELPEHTRTRGARPALVTGSSAERIAPVFRALKDAGLQPAAFSITEEPEVERMTVLADRAREAGCDCVVAFGGGSVLDAGKALAALLTNTEPLMHYLEVIGDGQPLQNRPAPCIAVPTTAGTGSEVTRNAVLMSNKHRVKVSMRHPDLLPDLALVDPELTLSMPPAVTAGTGLDALTQLLEAFVSAKAHPLTDGICREGLRRVGRSLHRAYTHGDDLKARTDMATGSLFGGMALANAGLGAVHGFAGPIGGMFKAPHGMVCAALLPAVYEANVAALKQRAAESDALAKYREAAALLTGSLNASHSDLLEWLKNICMQLAVPGLEDFGIQEQDLPAIVEKARSASSMKGNPLMLTDDELSGILRTALTAPLNGDTTLYL